MKKTYQLTLSNWESFAAPHFVIRDIPSSFRPPIRHSGEGRNPEGWGGVRRPNDEETARRITIFILLCALRKSMVIPAKSLPRTPIPGGNPEGWEGGHFLSPWERIEVRANLTAPEPLSTQGFPTPRNFHPLMQPTQVHGDSRENGNPRTIATWQNRPATSHEQHPKGQAVSWCLGGALTRASRVVSGG